MRLVGSTELDWTPKLVIPGLTPKVVFFGQGNAAQAMQIVTASANSTPSRSQLKSLYAERKGKLPISLMIAVEHDDQVSIFGPDPDSESMERVMPEDAYSGAFDAWQVAQRSIHEDWQKLTDPNNLIAPLPKSFRDALELVKKKGIYLGAAEQTRTLKRLSSVPPHRVSTRMRGVLSLDLKEPEKIQKIIDLLDEQGIQEANEPKALPPVSIGEVRLVTWMAVGKMRE